MRQARKVLAYLLWSKHIGLEFRREPHPGLPKAQLTAGKITHTKTAPGAWVSLGDLFFCNGSSVSLQDWVLQQQVAVAVN